MTLPSPVGLYTPADEHDACGLGFIASLAGPPARRYVDQGLTLLSRLSHRGASGADPESGDGAGILTAIPHSFFERSLGYRNKELPLAGDYGVAQLFLSRDPGQQVAQMATLDAIVRYHGQKLIAWRDVPTNPNAIGPGGRDTMPVFRQAFIGRMCDKVDFERTLFMIRRRVTRRVQDDGIADGFYVASLSSETLVYKGLVLPERLSAFYKDLAEDDYKTRYALVHSRFSTNTFPTWERAHPYRRLCHNGEINTLRGNRNWMRSREGLLASRHFGEHLADFRPIIAEGGSDSASLDDVADFLLASGRSLPHAMMMLVPEAYGADASPAKRGFYKYHASLVEPWDGPAALLFTDGRYIGAMLDRNGLRPAKVVITRSGDVIVASEFGVLDIAEEDIVSRSRVAPGKMLLLDLHQGCIVPDDVIKEQIATRQPYAAWVEENRIHLSDLADGTPRASSCAAQNGIGSPTEATRLFRLFGYTREDVRVLLLPMAQYGEEPTGSMGNDSALAVLSPTPLPLFRYFKQQFAQVTNPPIDPLREGCVMSLESFLGAEGNLLDEDPSQCRVLELPHPILSSEALRTIQNSMHSALKVRTISLEFTRPKPGTPVALALERELARIFAEATRAIDEGCSALVLSDRGMSKDVAAVPSLLAISALHQHLIACGKRPRASLVVDTGEAREVADVALLLGYGAAAVCPYVALHLCGELAARELGIESEKAEANYIKALQKGLFKILSKMGISTLASYTGAQIFEVLGISTEVAATHFGGTASSISGLGLEEIGREALARFDEAGRNEEDLPVGGTYAYRVGGEAHLWTPESVAALQKAVQVDDASSYDAYAKAINEQGNRPVTLRGLWQFAPKKKPVDLTEVESAHELVKRFATGAMSFGSISQEAHENLAIAMNRIGAKSNTGEGGEDALRFLPMADGTSKRSAIKQVASARFGVTTNYLVNADEIQIKMAQGAKPGEGGQLPGHKVDALIARVRHATPGVTLISPPPHHDIYSIEDLAQLIFDLRNVNPRARISVKLVAESGVGTVAAGVAKAHADAILIAGHDGGTGASPLSSVYHAGIPWEIGLAEVQQVLELNGLRDRVVLQADGQLKTGRDVAIAALLGAEEFGFSTAPLVASGCVMMRKCHLNTCPVGIATQDPILRMRFRGTPEHVIRYFFFVAEELRAIMASLGFRRLSEMRGRSDCLETRSLLSHPKAQTLDFGRLLTRIEAPTKAGDATKAGIASAVSVVHSSVGNLFARNSVQDAHDPHRLLADVVDHKLLALCKGALASGQETRFSLVLANSNRAFGTMLSGEIARRYGETGLPANTITIYAEGTAGQSFGAFATQGLTIVLEGVANDYVGKGLSGGTLVIKPPREATFNATEQVIVGNTVLYGATTGRGYFRGRAGERFAVRNSGAHAVIEGVGDHGCEYMTGGVVAVLGPIGKNFAAGMSGGIAYVLSNSQEEHLQAETRINLDMVSVLNPDADDRQTLLTLLGEHVRLTGSDVGAEWLRKFADASALADLRVHKVIGREYHKLSLRPPAAGALAQHATGQAVIHG